MPETDGRPRRFCDVCTQVDDHPRHVQSQKGGAPLVRHLDCCAAQGCEVCQTTEAVTGGARGKKLLEKIQSGALDGLEV